VVVDKIQVVRDSGHRNLLNTSKFSLDAIETLLLYEWWAIIAGRHLMRQLIVAPYQPD
jgi:hypothetical protein